METVPHWTAGWNRAGYGVESPESVMHGGTIADAFAHLQSQLEFERDDVLDCPDEQEFIDAIDELTQVDQRGIELEAARSRRSDGWSVTVTGWEYWVMACYTAGCDQVDDEA